MKIIKYGNRKLKTKRQYYESIFDAEPSEYKTTFAKNTKYNTVTCPCCGLQVMQAEEE